MKRIGLLLAILASAALVIASWRGWIESSPTEALGFVTGAACVYLVARQNVWNFPIAIANCIFFLVLFYETRLYGDAGLQVVYIGLAIHGWYWWLFGGENRTELHVSKISLGHAAAIAAFVPIGTAALTALLRWLGGAAPLLDSFTTVLSLAAQYMLNRKLLENWYVWIFADVLYIYLYISRDLYLTALLYLVFIGLCVAGIVQWRRSLEQEGRALEEAVPEGTPGG